MFAEVTQIRSLLFFIFNTNFSYHVNVFLSPYSTVFLVLLSECQKRKMEKTKTKKYLCK